MSERDDLARTLFITEADPANPEVGERLWGSITLRTPESEWHWQADALLASPWLTEVKAEAWDEGWIKGLSDGQRTDGHITDNPYRSES